MQADFRHSISEDRNSNTSHGIILHIREREYIAPTRLDITRLRNMGNDTSSSMSPKEMEDLKKNTTFSQEEINDWYRKFHEDCPSGMMSRDDFRSMYSQIFPKGNASEFADHVFHVYDKDGNGCIDFREFVCTLSVASRGSIDDKLRWAFSLYDIDGNGYVTKTEVMEIFSAMGKMRGGSQNPEDWAIHPEDAAEQLFRQLDKNGDEKLSDIEFILGAKSSPSVLTILNAEGAVE